MFDSLTADERLALRDTLSRGANSASKVTLTLGDVALKTLTYDNPHMGHVWSVRSRFHDMADEIRDIAFPELSIP